MLGGMKTFSVLSVGGQDTPRGPVTHRSVQCSHLCLNIIYICIALEMNMENALDDPLFISMTEANQCQRRASYTVLGASTSLPTVERFLKELRLNPPYAPTLPPLGMHLQDSKAIIHHRKVNFDLQCQKFPSVATGCCSPSVRHHGDHMLGTKAAHFMWPGSRERKEGTRELYPSGLYPQSFTSAN